MKLTEDPEAEIRHGRAQKWLQIILLLLVIGVVALFLWPVIEGLVSPPATTAPIARTTHLIQLCGVRLVQLGSDLPEKPPESFFRNGEVSAGAKALARIFDLLGPSLAEDPLEELVQDKDGTSMLVDSYGQPLIFIPKSLYGHKFDYRNTDGKIFEVVPLQARLHLDYQIWSMGANGIDDRGKGDDVVLPLSKEEKIQGKHPVVSSMNPGSSRQTR